MKKLKGAFCTIMFFALFSSTFAQTENLTSRTAEELLLLGYSYALGENGVSEDLTKAREYFLLSAQKGNAEAMTILSKLNLVDCEDAIKWLNKAIDKNFLPAYSRLSTLYYIGNSDGQNACLEADYKKAYQYAKIAAEGGEDEGQRLFGLYNIWGIGTTSDETVGVRWLEQSGLNNNENAMMDLKGFFFEKKDYVKYSYWLKKAAESGLAEAQYEYGKILYSNEYGLPTMENDACRWVELSARQGYGPAIGTVAWYYWSGIGGAERNKDKATEWCRLGIKQFDDMECKWLLSEILNQDDVERITLLKEAAAAGHKNSLAEYAYLNVVKKVPNADSEWGLQILESLSDQNVPRAMARYGCFLYDGEYVKENKTKAYSLVCKAADAGDFMGALYKRYIEVYK